MDRHGADTERSQRGRRAPRQRPPPDPRRTVGHHRRHGGCRRVPCEPGLRLRHGYRDSRRRRLRDPGLTVRVLIVDAIAPEGLSYLRDRGFQVDELRKPSAGELHAALPAYEALITRSGTAVTAELLTYAPNLRIVGRAGVGVDNVDVDACSRRGIVVLNAPYGNVVSAAEHTVGMLLALVRRIPEAHQRLKSLEWNRGIYGSELFRKTIGIVGLGKVGSRVAARLRGFEAEVLVYDPFISEARTRDSGARLVTTFKNLLRSVDVLTFHVPLTDETEGMVGARELALMKPGV